MIRFKFRTKSSVALVRTPTVSFFSPRNRLGFSSTVRPQLRDELVPLHREWFDFRAREGGGSLWGGLARTHSLQHRLAKTDHGVRTTETRAFGPRAAPQLSDPHVSRDAPTTRDASHMYRSNTPPLQTSARVFHGAHRANPIERDPSR